MKFEKHTTYTLTMDRMELVRLRTMMRRQVEYLSGAPGYDPEQSQATKLLGLIEEALAQ